MDKTLLLVIDVQNSFVNENTKPILKKIEDLVKSKKYDDVVFTKFINNENSIWYKKLNYRKCLNDEQRQIAVDTLNYKVFEKYIYSALTDELINYIKENNFNKIYLCGFDTDACVYKTALDLFEKGYDVSVLKDYCMSHKGVELHNIMINNLKRLIGEKNII